MFVVTCWADVGYATPVQRAGTATWMLPVKMATVCLVSVWLFLAVSLSIFGPHTSDALRGGGVSVSKTDDDTGKVGILMHDHQSTPSMSGLTQHNTHIRHKYNIIKQL